MPELDPQVEFDPIALHREFRMNLKRDQLRGQAVRRRRCMLGGGGGVCDRRRSSSRATADRR
jgi:hypothetical protein